MGAHYFLIFFYFKKKRDRIDLKMFETKNTLFYNTKGWVRVIKSKPLPIIKGQKHYLHVNQIYKYIPHGVELKAWNKQNTENYEEELRTVVT